MTKIGVLFDTESSVKGFTHYLKDYGLRTLHDTSFYGNERLDELPLLVNCAGLTYARTPHINSNDKDGLDYCLIYVPTDAVQILSQEGWQGLVPESVIIIPPEAPYECKCAIVNDGATVVLGRKIQMKNLMDC